MKKLVLLCNVMLMYCLSVNAQTFAAVSVKDAADDASTVTASEEPLSGTDGIHLLVSENKSIKVLGKDAVVKNAKTAKKQEMVTITLQNNIPSSYGQIQFVASTSGGTNASYNFTGTQTISVASGSYTVYMRGPSAGGQTFAFAYQTCATFGSATGVYTTFSNVYICANGTFSLSAN